MVTLIPPAVPADPPPMNINTSEPRRVPELSCPGSKLLKPAVRSMVALKNPDSKRSLGWSWPRVRGFPHSARVKNGAGDEQQHRHADGQFGMQAPSARRNSRCRSSRSTGKPIPPMMTAAAIGKQIQGVASEADQVVAEQGKPGVVERTRRGTRPAQWPAPTPRRSRERSVQ